MSIALSTDKDKEAESQKQTTPILTVRNLKTYFPIRKGVFGRTVGHVRAVDNIDLDVYAGECLGLVGESGSGKTTLGRSILRLIEPQSGSIHYKGQDLLAYNSAQMREQRRHLQMIFQDPYSSLNPRLSIREALCEPMIVHGLAKNRDDASVIAQELLEKVGLEKKHLNSFPHQFSGGQRQRIGIARALSIQPELIVCDEAVSALDVSVQAQVLNLLRDIQEERGVSYIFIAHDLSVVDHFCQRVAVLYLGEIVEEGPVEEIYRAALHPYTRALLAAVPPDHPSQKRERIRLEGDAPSPLEPSSAKRFITRFPRFATAFEPGEIRMHDLGNGHRVRCANPDALREMAGL